MFDTKTEKRIPLKYLFLLGALVGAVCFIGVYGVKILNPVNTGWLFNNDHDLRQHYIGWCAFRSDPWHFPIGLIDSLSYPDSMSVIYTDSIPLFAVFFKLMRAFLPQTFQYFGLFGIMSFAVMGGLSSILLRRFVASDILCVTGSVFYVLSAPVIQRMYFHTALAAQWIIIGALIMWVYDDLIGSDRMKILLWALIGFICVGIHSYFLPMAGMILAALMITQIAKNGKIFVPAAEFLAFSAAGILNLYILGGFYGMDSAAGPGLGTFTSNLNTFINPWEIGQILPRLPLQNDFQYEGMAYLGAGILLLFIVVAAGMVFRMIRHVPEEAFHTKKIYGRVAIVLVIISFVSAVSPNISFNDKLIVWIPYPGIIERTFAIFRSNGRLVWPAMYILITAAVSFAAYSFRHYKQVSFILIAGALLLQICDMTNAFAKRYELYDSDFEIETVWDNEEASEFIKGKKEFIFLYTDNDITMQTAYYGYLHGMRQNNFYFARDIEDKVRQEIDIYTAELRAGNIRDDAVYVMRYEDYDRDPQLLSGLNADIMERFDHIVFKASKQ